MQVVLQLVNFYRDVIPEVVMLLQMYPYLSDRLNYWRDINELDLLSLVNYLLQFLLYDWNQDRAEINFLLIKLI